MTILRRALLVLAALLLGVFVVAALWPGLLTPADPLQTDVSAALLPPTADHPFGTDQSGRDVFARVVHGTRQSLGVGVLATAIALVAGTLLGTLVGVAPRIVDAVAMRLVDVLLAVPEFLIALVVVALIGPGATNVALAVTIAVTPVYIRYARAHTHTLRAQDHVEAARLLGLRSVTVVARHVLPGVLRRLSVLATLGIGTSILAVAGLSFLGLGVGEPTPEWGLILSGGRNVLGRAWWITLFPGLAITLTVLATSLLGRALRARMEATA
ncbi:ABC transporter permease [Microbacterium gorillae]|uniref:ABC transporter permease n=1 Tax=Microbacterium gorillae TaxID=1231063 RepID=UPI00058E9682|nr:ABC transporter permease [Microbacterium gorillae]